MPGLAERSRRPWSSPRRLSAEVEALICDMRRLNPRWICYELGRQGLGSSLTVHRVLVRNGLVVVQPQEHKRVYRRWRRCSGGSWIWLAGCRWPLADGREAKMATGIDDHYRFVVIAAVVALPSGRAVCAAFTAAMRRMGCRLRC